MHIVSKDSTPCVYDFAKEIYEMQELVEEIEGRKLTEDEFLLLSAMVMQMNERR